MANIVTIINSCPGGSISNVQGILGVTFGASLANGGERDFTSYTSFGGPISVTLDGGPTTDAQLILKKDGLIQQTLELTPGFTGTLYFNSVNFFNGTDTITGESLVNIVSIELVTLVYNIQYYIRFQNELESDVEIQLLQKNGPIVSDPPILSNVVDMSITMDSENGLKFDSVISRSLSVTLNLQEEDVITWETFIASEQDEWKVICTINGLFHFHGFLTPETGGALFLDKPYDVTLQATDCLKLLDQFPLTDVNGSNWNNSHIYNLPEHYLNQYVAGIFASTKLKLPFRIYGSLVEDTQFDRNTDPFLDYYNQTKVDYRTFLKDPTNFQDCGTVLKAIISGHSRVFYWNGIWVIYYLPDHQFRPGGLWFTNYHPGGTYIDGGEETTNYIEVGFNKVVYPINADAQISSVHAVQSYKTVFNYNSWDEIPLNNKFDRGDLIPELCTNNQQEVIGSGTSGIGVKTIVVSGSIIKIQTMPDPESLSTPVRKNMSLFWNGIFYLIDQLFYDPFGHNYIITTSSTPPVSGTYSSQTFSIRQPNAEAYTVDDWDYGSTTEAFPYTLTPTSTKVYTLKTYDQFGIEISREVISQEPAEFNVNWLVSKPIPVLQGDTFDFSVDKKFYVDFHTDIPTLVVAYIWIVNGDDEYTVQAGYSSGDVRDGSWTHDQAGQIQLQMPDSTSTYHTISFSSFPFPISGNLYIALRYNNVIDNRFLQYFQNLSFTYNSKVTGSNQILKGDYWLRSQNKFYLDNAEEEVFLSDSNRKAIKGALIRTDGTLSNSWHRFNVNEHRKFKDLINQGRYNEDYRRFFKIDGNFDGINVYSQNVQTQFFPLYLHKEYRFTDLQNPTDFILVCPITMDVVKERFSATFVEIVKPGQPQVFYSGTNNFNVLSSSPSTINYSYVNDPDVGLSNTLQIFDNGSTALDTGTTDLSGSLSIANGDAIRVVLTSGSGLFSQQLGLRVTDSTTGIVVYDETILSPTALEYDFVSTGDTYTVSSSILNILSGTNVTINVCGTGDLFNLANGNVVADATVNTSIDVTLQVDDNLGGSHSSVGTIFAGNTTGTWSCFINGGSSVSNISIISISPTSGSGQNYIPGSWTGPC